MFNGDKNIVRISLFDLEFSKVKVYEFVLAELGL